MAPVSSDPGQTSGDRGNPSAAVASPAALLAGTGRAPETHCPFRQTTLLQHALSSNKMPVAFFLGAGCPTAIRVPNGDSSKPLIPDITGLTAAVQSQLAAGTKATYDKIAKRLAATTASDTTIEHVLSHTRALLDVVGGGEIDGMGREELLALEEGICSTTNDVVNAALPNDSSPYHKLASWISAIPRDNAVEIFTTNYDLLMEQALEDRRIPYFDGFVGSKRTFFDLPSVEQHGSLPSRWGRLWKVHGSINWWQHADGSVERGRLESGMEGARMLIHPSHLKYDQSRRMPYLALLDRLRGFLSQGQAVLVTSGYSFSDAHLNDMILQGLQGNPRAACIGLLYGDRKTAPEAVRLARNCANLSLFAVDGAVIGTVEGDWAPLLPRDESLSGVSVQTGPLGGRTAAEDGAHKFLLGDFAALAAFLTRELSVQPDRQEQRNGR